MKKGDVLLGTLVGFRYITGRASSITYCLVLVADATGKQFKVILGTRETYPISALMEMKKAGCQIQATCAGIVDKELRFNDATPLF